VVAGLECAAALELEGMVGARVLDRSSDRLLARVPEQDDWDAVALAEREFASR
jgi:hypothetical protein